MSIQRRPPSTSRLQARAAGWAITKNQGWVGSYRNWPTAVGWAAALGTLLQLRPVDRFLPDDLGDHLDDPLEALEVDSGLAEATLLRRKTQLVRRHPKRNLSGRKET